MKFEIIPTTKFIQNCLVIWCSKSYHACIVDPGENLKKIIDIISLNKLKIKNILLTHGHIDHVAASQYFSNYFNVKILGPEKKDEWLFKNLPYQSEIFNFDYCTPFLPDVWLKNGDYLKIGNLNFKVIHCPGHTQGHIVFFEKNKRILISGDVIFFNSIGRTDLPKGNFKLLMNSIKKILTLGDDITFIPGHGIISTIGYEKNNNIYLKNL